MKRSILGCALFGAATVIVLPGSVALEALEAAPPAAWRRAPSGQVPLPVGSDADAARARLSPLAWLSPDQRAELVAVLRERLRRQRETSPSPAGRPRIPRPPSSSRAIRVLEAGTLLRRAERSRSIAGVEHTRYRLFKQGKPLFNHTGILRERGESLVGRAGRLAFPPVASVPRLLSKDDAVAAALRAARVEVGRGSPVIEEGWFATPGSTRPAWRVVIPAQRPFGTWQVIVDAHSGSTLALVDLVRTITGVGSVYDPNRALAPVPVDVPLERLDGSGRLQGDIVRVFDARAPAAFRPGNAFRFPEDDPRFVQTSVYRGVTDSGIFAEGHGFPIFGEPLIAYTNLQGPLGGEYNNAYYDPFFRLLGFGNGDGSLTANLGTDLDVAAHETGHHLFEVLAEPLIFSLADPALAMHEGVADTIAALVGGDPHIGESTIPGQPFLRTVENSAAFPSGFSESPHTTGLVYGGANWDLIQLLGPDTFTNLLFTALARLPPEPVETDYRDAFLDANLASRGGVGQAQIQAIFTARGFDELDFPSEFEGFLDDGVPSSRFLPDSPNSPDPANWNFHVFGFFEFPHSRSVSFRTTGSGDVDLLVFSVEDQTTPVASAENPGSNELIILNQFSQPSIDVGDTWAVAVFDFPDLSGSSYTVTATTTLPLASISIGGQPFQGSIDAPGGFDAITFQNNFSNRVVRLEAQALDPTLDPLVGIIDPRTLEVLGVDDDSGPGQDALIQGALLPTPGTYAIVIVSLTADVDPSQGTGRYELRLTQCNNSVGANTDGDELVDACDDDDDNDTFVDSQDSDPLDPARCADLDQDECDDCSSGVLDIFADGPDNDSDGLCDVGDPDDDNDGCTDEVDHSPLQVSPDADFDFLGSDCDNCPERANPDQDDADDDSAGDACDNCTLVANPDQADFDAGADDDSSLEGIQHYGDACDADMDNNGLVNTADFFGFFRPCLGANVTLSPSCGRADLDGSGTVNTADFFGFFRPQFGSAPGPGSTGP